MEETALYDRIHSKLLNTYGQYMHLKIFVDFEDENENGELNLKQKYLKSAEEHNAKLLSSDYLDAGFDLYVPEQSINRQYIYGKCINKIDHKVICSAKVTSGVNSQMRCSYNSGYYMYPRSSVSKLGLRLANSVGIIDSGYRGHIIGMFDVVAEIPIYNKYDRVVQICAPGLMPIYVEIVDTIEELGGVTERGDGGFGSSGK